MLKTGPDPKDVQDIQFKLHCRLKVFDRKLDNCTKSYSLISCASRYGLLFVGSDLPNLQAIQVKCFEMYSPKDKDISNYPRRNISLPSPANWVCVNCDCTILAVVVEKEGCPTVIFYDVLSFYKQNIAVIKELPLSATPGTNIVETNWNPALPAVFAACKTDGTLIVFEIKGSSVNINELPQIAETASFSWSPKGKQIAVGSRNGNITQYKPDLKAVKVIPAPPLGGPHSPIALLWVSNYQFIGIYAAAQTHPKLIVVDAPKTGEITYTNYDDICYSNCDTIPQFYMILQKHWNMLMVASSNSTELGVVSATAENWTQWIMPDSARAELPLGSDRQETLPVGLSLDISSTRSLQWGEETIPPCPYLLMLSNHGVLCFFNIVNLKKEMPTICTPPDNISDFSGLSEFVVESVKVLDLTKDNPIIQPQTTLSFEALQNNAPRQSSLSVISNTPPTFESVQKDSSSIEAVEPLQDLAKKQPSGVGAVQMSTLPTPPSQTLTQPPPVIAGVPSLSGIKSNNLQSTNESVPSDKAIEEKYSAIFATLNASTSVVISAAEAKKNEPLLEKPVSVILKPNAVNSTVIKTVNENSKMKTVPMLIGLVREECISLNSEVQALLCYGREIEVGSEDEKSTLLNGIQASEEFIKELVEVSMADQSEIHVLRHSMLLAWSWYAEARSHYIVPKDGTVGQLLQVQPLDSATKKRQSDIKKLICYIGLQLQHANKTLDEQWYNFQEHTRKTSRQETPIMENIFQAMVTQGNILQKQAYILLDIERRLKHRTRPDLVSSENILWSQNKLSQLHTELTDTICLLSDRLIRKNMSLLKTCMLRKLLKNRKVVNVPDRKSRSPASSMSVSSPVSKNKQIISIFEAQRSSLQKKVAARSLNFPQSAPSCDFKLEIKPTSAPPNTPAQNESLKNFTFKGLENANTTTTSTFVPFKKTTSTLSNLIQPSITPSAFVPTTHSSKLFNLSNTAPPSTTSAAAAAITTTTPLFLFGSGDIQKTSIATSESPPTMLTTVTASPFNFGSNITITPLSSKKADSFTAENMRIPKPFFNFGTTTAFGANATTKATVAVSNTPNSRTASIFDTLSHNSRSATATNTISKGKVHISAAPSIVPVTCGVQELKPTFFSTSAPSTATTTKLFSSTSINTTVVSAPNDKSIFAAELTAKSAPVVTDTNSVSFLNILAPTSLPATTANADVNISAAITPVDRSLIFPDFGTTSSSTSTLGAFSTTSLDSTAAITVSCSVSPAHATTLNSKSVLSSGAAIANTPVSTSVALKTTSVTTYMSDSDSAFGSDSTGESNNGSPRVPTTTAKSSPISITVSTAPCTTSVFTPTLVSPTGSISISDSSETTAATSTNLAISPNATMSSTTTTVSIFGSGSVTTSPSSIIFSSVTTAATATSKPDCDSTTSISTGSQFGASLTIAPSTATLLTPTAGNISGGPIHTFGSSSTMTSDSTGLPAFSSIATGTSASSFSFVATGTLAASTSIISSTDSAPSIGTCTLGSVTATTTTSVSGSVTTNIANQSIFDNSTTSVTTKPSIFAGKPMTTKSSIFGSNNTASIQQQGSIFGGSTISGSLSNTTTTQSGFGLPITTSTTQPSTFGLPTSSGSIFGVPPSSAPSFGSIFGAVPVSATPPFGQANNAFGSPQKPTSSAFTFGSSIFGATPATTTSSIFGEPPPSSFEHTNLSSAFAPATTSTSIFGSSNVFALPATTSSFSFAAPPGNTASTSFGSLSVSNNTTTSSNAFGTATPFEEQTMANPFGRIAEHKPTFGGDDSIFGSSRSSASSIFGMNNPNSFGSSSTFGQPLSSASNSFNNTAFASSPSQPGPFSAGGAGVAQRGFGSSPAFQKTNGFGGAPVFGTSSQSAFGANPSFGGAPAFGSAPSFGSPDKVFGSSSSTTGTFGNSTTENSGFGNLANQTTVGFGNLAQAGTSSTSIPFAGSSSFSSWR